MGKLVESGNAFGTYQGLPACQFLFYGVQRTDGMGEVKIADVAHGMRQTLQSVEGRSSFEIQKDEMEGLRTMPNRQCHAARRNACRTEVHHFVKVQVGVNAKSGPLGEVSTEVFSFADLSIAE